MDQFQELPLNQFVDKSPRRSATKFPRQHMSLLPRRIVAVFLIPFALMSRSASVRSPKELFKRLFLGGSVELRPGKTARLLKISGSSVTLFRMSNATTSRS